MSLEGDFHGNPTRILENEFIRLEYLLSAPRIVRLNLRGRIISSSTWEMKKQQLNLAISICAEVTGCGIRLRPCRGLICPMSLG